jgi:hypothetical protein
MGFFSCLKYTFIIFAVHLATSCGAPFENHRSRYSQHLKTNERTNEPLVLRMWNVARG